MLAAPRHACRRGARTQRLMRHDGSERHGASRARRACASPKPCIRAGTACGALKCAILFRYLGSAARGSSRGDTRCARDRAIAILTAFVAQSAPSALLPPPHTRKFGFDRSYADRLKPRSRRCASAVSNCQPLSASMSFLCLYGGGRGVSDRERDRNSGLGTGRLPDSGCGLVGAAGHCDLGCRSWSKVQRPFPGGQRKRPQRQESVEHSLRRSVDLPASSREL